jgi:hypothetical protein
MPHSLSRVVKEAIAALGGSPSRIGSRYATRNSLKRPKELQQILFFRQRQFGAEDQVEKLDRIVQRQEQPVVQVGVASPTVSDPFKRRSARVAAKCVATNWTANIASIRRSPGPHEPPRVLR